jgi:hypothetical protein
MSGVPAEQRLLRAQRSTVTHLMRACARRGQSTRSWRTGQSTGPVRCTTGQPRGPTCQSSNGRTPPADVAGAPDCLVRHATAAFQRPYFGGWGYKYPNHPTFNCIQVSNLQHITRAIAFNSRHSKEIKSSPKSGITPNQIVTRESDICVHLSSCAWIASFLSHSSCDHTQL